MTRRARAYLAVAATAIAVAAALTGCAQSSNTTTSSTSTGAPGTAPPSSSTPTSTSTTGSATTGTPSGSHPLGVSPTVGSPQSTMRFSFTSPVGSGPEGQGGTLISSALSVVGPHGSGCVGVHQEALPSEPAGQSVNVAVGPTQLGGSWCPGTYTARVEVLARPKCGQGMMCPQFIRLVAVLGPTTFRIRG
jgi:hypothetical protein